MRDLELANRLRARGLKVVETAGWKTRGSDSFNPKGSVNHHTAGARFGNAPSLNVCINGRSDLPGPLCHVMMARDNTCYVIASGRANHAGPGGWKGLTGNSSVYGLEWENVGTSAEPIRPDQYLAMVQVHAAFLEGTTKNASLTCNHREWAPLRKIDAYGVNGERLRQDVAKALLTKEEDILMAITEERFEALENKIDAIAGLVLQQEKDYGMSGVGMRQVIVEIKAAVVRIEADVNDLQTKVG